MNQLENAIGRLSILIEIVPKKLETRNEDEFARQPWLGMWSKKQLLGQLIDAAAMCHQRVVRIQYENEPIVVYNRKQWMDLQHYNSADSDDLIQLWKWYNKHLLHVFKHIPKENLEQTKALRSGIEYSLESVVDDYISRLEKDVRNLFGSDFFGQEGKTFSKVRTIKRDLRESFEPGIT